MTMWACDGCDRWIRATDPACPFCGPSRRVRAHAIARGLVLGVGLWLTGCGDDPSPEATNATEGDTGTDVGLPGPYDSCGMTYAGPGCGGWPSFDETTAAPDAPDDDTTTNTTGNTDAGDACETSCSAHDDSTSDASGDGESSTSESSSSDSTDGGAATTSQDR